MLGDERPDGADRAARRRGYVLEVVAVLGTLFVLELLVFWAFFVGYASPQFDFIGSYNTEFYALWRDGSFFRPQEWTPYLWGGYPAAVSLQNSSYYLPVGILAQLTTYDIHAAAALHALHVAFGALGCYVLVRRWGGHPVAALLGLSAFFFASGFFANAQHVDIVHGYAFAPWLLLVLSPAWPWRRWWGIPLAALLLWQALVGIYPGMIVSTVYVGGVYVLALLLWKRPRLLDYLVPLAVAGLSAALLAMPKFLPALALRGSDTPTGAEVSEFNLAMLGTLFFPYGGDNLTYEMSMRSFFVPVTVMALVALAPWRRAETRAVASVLTVAVLVALPTWPWFDALGALPGMDLSRFRMSDFRVYILLALVLLAALGTDAAIRGVRARAGAGAVDAAILTLRRWPLVVYLLLLGAAAGVLGHRGGYTPVLWAPTVALLLCAALGTLLLAGVGPASLRLPRPDARLIAATLVTLTIASGVAWAYSTTRPWLAVRVAAETETLGRPVADLIAEGLDPATADRQARGEHVQRPARTPLTEDPVPVIEFQKAYDAAFYTGVAAVGGYTNLKGAQGFEAIRALFLDPATSLDARAFYAAPGIAVRSGTDGIPDPELVAECVRTQSCGEGVTVTPVAYAPGRFVYDVTADDAGPLDLNEAYYEGWTARTCTAADDPASCSPAPAAMGPVGNLRVEVPAGSVRLEVEYSTPGLTASWLLFWAGVAVAALGAVGVGLLRARSRRPEESAREGAQEPPSAPEATVPAPGLDASPAPDAVPEATPDAGPEPVPDAGREATPDTEPEPPTEGVQRT